MLDYISLKLNKKLSKQYGIEIVEIQELLREKTQSDYSLGLLKLIFRFNESKIKDIYQTYCTNHNEITFLSTLLENFRFFYIDSPEPDYVKLLTNSFITGYISNEEEIKLYWDLMMQINPEEYSVEYFKSIFGPSRIISLSTATDILGSNVLRLEFGGLKNLKSIIRSSLNETINEYTD